MKKLFILFLLSFCFVASSFAVKDSLIIGAVKAYPNDTILVPVYLNDVNKDSIAGIYVRVLFNSNDLKFVSFQNINAALSGALYNTSGDTAGFVWLMYNAPYSVVFKTRIKLYDMQFALKNNNNSTMCVDTSNAQSAIVSPKFDKYGINIPYSVNWLCGNITKINKIKPDGGMNFYPNPSDGHFYLNGINGNKDISVYNVNGEMIYDKQVNGHNSTYQIDLSNYSKGTYILKITGNDDVTYRKLINE